VAHVVWAVPLKGLAIHNFIWDHDLLDIEADDELFDLDPGAHTGELADGLLRENVQKVGKKILHNECGLSIRHTLTSCKHCMYFAWNHICFVLDEHTEAVMNL
jgi:hypothetical protein